MKLILSKIALALLAGASMGAVSQSSLAADSKAFLVGVTIPKSGAAAQFGPIVESGMRVAVKHINEGGGILGRKVELLIRDSGSNPQRALLAAKELVEEQKVDFLFPELISGLVLAVLPYTTERKVLTISAAGSPRTGDAKEFPYNFQIADFPPKRAPAMGSAIKKFGGKKVGILVATNPAMLANGEQLKADLPAKFGMQVVGFREFPVDAKDLTANLQALRDAGADIIAFDSMSREGIRAVMTGMQTLAWNAKVVSGSSALSGDLKELVPAPVQNQFYALNYRAGTKTGPLRPELQQFITELRKAGPIANLGLALMNRDILYLVKYGYEKAAREKGSATAENVKAVLESIGSAKDFPASYSLLLGNPRWTSGDHTTANADYSKLFGLVRVSTPVDGVYEGDELGAE